MMVRWYRVTTLLGSAAGGMLLMVRSDTPQRNTIDSGSDSHCDRPTFNRSRCLISAKCEDLEVRARHNLHDSISGFRKSGITDAETRHLYWKSVASRRVKKKIKQLLEQAKEEYGIPGLLCAISIDGKPFFVEGIGYSDVENCTKCTEDTVMRLASISKAMTSIAVGKLLQEKKLNLEAPVQDYVPDFPRKEINGKDVTITVHHILSHTSGIRHYLKKNTLDGVAAKDSEEKPNKKVQECYDKEYYQKNHFEDIKSSLNLFEKDPLRFEPGSDYLYTTFGYSLVSAVIEKVAKESYLRYMGGIFKDLGAASVVPEFNNKITKNRARHYIRNEKGQLENCPYVDNSYKWAGGGFIGNVTDLLKVGNALLYSYQNSNKEDEPGYLRHETVKKLWTPVEVTVGKVSKGMKDVGYGLGWCIRRNKRHFYGSSEVPFVAFHTGGAVGGSSILMIVPRDTSKRQGQNQIQQEGKELQKKEETLPRGTVIAIIANMQNVRLSVLAFKLAEYIEDMRNH